MVTLVNSGEVSGLTSGLPALARSSLSDRVVAIIKRYIVAERQPVGARLPAERQLADTLNVSRTVLREALNRLIGEGVLVRQSPRVLVIADPERAAVGIGPLNEQEAEFQDLMELRIFLEIGAIATLVMRAQPDQIAAIEEWVVEGERRATAGLPMHYADARFHSALLRAANNRAVDSMTALVEDQIRSYLMFSPDQLRHTDPDEDHRVAREHRAIYGAILARDPATARRVMESHLGHYLKLPTHDVN